MPPGRAVRWLPSILWMGVISYWSAQQTLPIDDYPTWRDLLHVLGHAGAFAVLGGLNRWALHGLPRATLLAFVLATGFGFVDEWHQTFVPGRAAEVLDLVTDTLAAAVGAPLAGRLLREWPRLASRAASRC